MKEDDDICTGCGMADEDCDCSKTEPLPVRPESGGSVPNLDQMALNHVAGEMRKTAMKFVNDRDHVRLMRAGELLAKAIEKDASRIGAKGLMRQNIVIDGINPCNRSKKR